MSRPAVVLGDLHLSRHTPEGVERDLALLLGQHAGARVVVCGDLFDLTADGERASSGRGVREALARSGIVRAAFAEHVDRGGELWLVAGNHDAEIASVEAVTAFTDALGATSEGRARVRSTPWFFCDGGLHLEHGHLFDPDNAPAHPLVTGAPSLGVHFVEEFIIPCGAYRYLNSNDGPPLGLFLAAFVWYGPRAPHVVYRYFHAALGALARSGPFYRALGESRAGETRLADFAESAGVDAAIAEQLVGLGARPTLESLAHTFSRLYLDRVIATLAMASGLGATLAGRRSVGAALGGLGALAMGTSWALGRDRYSGSVADRLAEGASAIGAATGARLVVFGHTHREAMSNAYANTASFAFPGDAPGRPYLSIEGSVDRPRAVRRYLVS